MVAFKPKRAAARDVNVNTPSDLVVVARLGVAYGVKGWIKLHPFSHSPDAVEYASTWWVAPYLPNQTEIPISAWQMVSVKTIKAHSDTWLVEFDGWADRTVAEAHKGWQVAISRADFPQTDEGEFYWVDLIGATVINRDGVTLGELNVLLESAAHPVMQVVGAAGEYLIPFVGAFVGEVDTVAKTIQVDWDVDALA
ncbi:MAG: ribosome maturation factor RimM [Formosimonas sp.]